MNYRKAAGSQHAPFQRPAVSDEKYPKNEVSTEPGRSNPERKRTTYRFSPALEPSSTHMDVTEATVRNIWTEAVFERGERYRDEGRIAEIHRVDTTVTAVVVAAVSTMFVLASPLTGLPVVRRLRTTSRGV